MSEKKRKKKNTKHLQNSPQQKLSCFGEKQSRDNHFPPLTRLFPRTAQKVKNLIKSPVQKTVGNRLNRSTARPKMLYLKSMTKIIDNSGALMAECIKVLGKDPANFAKVGDEIVCVIQKARPINAQITGASASNRVKKGDICHAVVVRTKQTQLRPDGSSIKFDDNACVLINKNSEPLGTRISGVVSRELKEKGYNKIVAMAPKAV